MFQHSAQELRNLFDQDNIRSGKSISIIQQWGGINLLLHSLATNIEYGIADDASLLRQRKKKYGENTLIPPLTNLWQMIKDCFEDRCLLILSILSAFDLLLEILRKGIENSSSKGIGLLIGIIILVLFQAGSRQIRQQKMKKWKYHDKKIADTRVEVIRNGRVKVILNQQLLVGDIQIIESKGIVCADGLLLENQNIAVDESNLTGESLEIKKTLYEPLISSNCNPFVLSSSYILQGKGKMVVLAIGKNSRYGFLKNILEIEDEQTPLQIKLADQAQKIGKFGMLLAIASFAFLLSKILYEAYQSDSIIANIFTALTLHKLIQALIVGFLLLIVTIPEHFSFIPTLVVIYSLEKMKHQNIQVRQYQACQRMGCINNILTFPCSILTYNRMKAVKVYTLQHSYSSPFRENLNKDVAQLLSLTISLNSSACPIFDGEIPQIDNRTDCALLELAFRLGFKYQQIRKKIGTSIIRTFPYSCDSKSSSVIVKQMNKITVYAKGSPDELIKKCVKYINFEGKSTDMNQNYHQTLAEKLTEYTDNSSRTVALAYKEDCALTEQANREEVQSNLTLVALIGIKDPIRQTIPDTVKQLKQAGVSVIIHTGDRIQTAIIKAKEAGILQADYKKVDANNYMVMTGAELRALIGEVRSTEYGEQYISNLEDFSIIAKELKVLVRSNPADKYTLAVGFSELNLKLAVIGDGAGDPPALKRASVGLACSQSTQVAKQASGIILLKDDLNSALSAIYWGRNIFTSVKNYLLFCLPVYFTLIFFTFAGLLFLGKNPFSPIQLIWLIIITSIISPFALTTGPLIKSNLSKKPQSLQSSIVSSEMKKIINSQSMIQITILFVLLLTESRSSSLSIMRERDNKITCMRFHTFIWMTIVSLIYRKIMCTKEIKMLKQISDNAIFIFCILAIIVIQLIIVEFGRQIADTAPLSLTEHCFCMGLGLVPLLLQSIYKFCWPFERIDNVQNIRENQV